MIFGDIKEALELAQWETKILRRRSPFDANMKPLLLEFMDRLHRERFHLMNEPLD